MTPDKSAVDAAVTLLQRSSDLAFPQFPTITVNNEDVRTILADHARLRNALTVPAVWTLTERDGMSAAFKRASEKHGHYESLFAVAAFILRHRAEADGGVAAESEAAALRVRVERVKEVGRKILAKLDHPTASVTQWDADELRAALGDN